MSNRTVIRFSYANDAYRREHYAFLTTRMGTVPKPGTVPLRAVSLRAGSRANPSLLGLIHLYVAGLRDLA